MKEPFSQSNIYLGNIVHRRFSQKQHSFNFSLYMLALDVSEIENTHKGLGLFGFSWYHPLRFVEIISANSLPSKCFASSM